MITSVIAMFVPEDKTLLLVIIAIIAIIAMIAMAFMLVFPKDWTFKCRFKRKVK